MTYNELRYYMLHITNRHPDTTGSVLDIMNSSSPHVLVRLGPLLAIKFAEYIEEHRNENQTRRT